MAQPIRCDTPDHDHLADVMVSRLDGSLTVALCDPSFLDFALGVVQSAFPAEPEPSPEPEPRPKRGRRPPTPGPSSPESADPATEGPEDAPSPPETAQDAPEGDEGASEGTPEPEGPPMAFLVDGEHPQGIAVLVTPGGMVPAEPDAVG